MKIRTTRARTLPKGAKCLVKQTSPPVRTDSERRLRWLLGFARESSGLRTATERRTVYKQLGACLDGLLIRRAGEDSDRHPVMRGDPLTPAAFTMGRGAHQISFEDQVELIRTDVRRIVTQFLSAPKGSLRVRGEIAWQRILEKAPGRAPTFRERWVAADVREGITFRLLEDLEKAGALVRQCPATGCGRVFVRRYRQEFCESACRNRTNFRIWYQGTRKKSRAMVFLPQRATKRKRLTHWRRARIMGNPTRRTKSA